MKELMKELKLSTWDNGTLFVITDKYAYPFCGDIRFADCLAPTMAEIERTVDDFADDDMRGYGGFPLTDERVAEAVTIWAIVQSKQSFQDAASTVISFTREAVGDVSTESLTITHTGRKVTFDKVPTEKFAVTYTDRDDDELRIISNNQRDPSGGELFITAGDNGVVLKREQALDLAARINAYFTTN